jgi:hypothetical protein
LPVLLASWLFAAFVIGCSLASPASTAISDRSPEPPQASPGSPPVPFGNYPEFHDSSTGLTVIFGTPDLAVGDNRLAFAITDSQGFVRLPVVTLRTFFYSAGAGGPRDGPVETVVARFHEFPLGTRGSYVTYARLDRAGVWGFESSFPRPDGTVASSEFRMDVPDMPSAPGTGRPAPRSANPTLSSAGSLDKLTTASEPDPALYRQTIADAIDSGRPTIVVFTSPAFCTTPLCGPQVDVVSGLRSKYGDRANFIHVDLYESPDQIKGDLSRAKRSPVVEEWGLKTDEWTFIIDRSGRIAGRFESFAGEVELAESLERVLAGG